MVLVSSVTMVAKPKSSTVRSTESSWTTKTAPMVAHVIIASTREVLFSTRMLRAITRIERRIGHICLSSKRLERSKVVDQLTEMSDSSISLPLISHVVELARLLSCHSWPQITLLTPSLLVSFSTMWPVKP